MLRLRILAALGVIACLTTPVLGAVQTPAKKPTTSATAKKRPTGTKRGKSSRGRGKRQSWRTGQMTPTPERYKEIQQALIDKGYMQGAATGVWGPDSVQALKKFQQDQKLEPSGKIDSLSLISLGLGPKRERTASTAPPATPPAGSETHTQP